MNLIAKTKRMLLSILALCTVAAAARADTGQRLEIVTQSKLQGSDVEAILHTLVGDAGAEQAKRRITAKLELLGADTHLLLEVNGSLLPADSADRIRAMFPALQNAQISLVATDGSPGIGVEPGELNTPEQIAAFKAKLQAKLVAEGKSGTVEVTVTTGADGKRQVRVEVKAEKDN